MRAAELVVASVLGGCLYTNNTKCEQPGYPPDDEIVLVDPAQLFCVSFPVPGCDLDCGPCTEPEGLPTWAECDGTCVGLDETECLERPGCRLGRFRSGYYSPLVSPSDSYRGCYAVDTVPGTATDCRGTDPQECSRYDHCSWLVDFDSTGECIPEHQVAGRCAGDVTCTEPPPSCAPDTTPGILDGCYTGSCIPNEYCAPQAPPNSVGFEYPD